MQIISELRGLLEPGGRAVPDEAAAQRLWAAVLDGGVDPLELGALLAALALRGAAPEELRGLLEAVRERQAGWPAPLPASAVCIPAYGLFPDEPLVVATAAALLPRFGVKVVVHGLLDSACGMASACVLRELGLPPSGTLAQAAERLQREGAAFVPAALLSPGFAALLALRARLGGPNAAHAVAQGLDPLGGAGTRLLLEVGGTPSAAVAGLLARFEGTGLLLSWPAGGAPGQLAQGPRMERLDGPLRERLFDADARAARRLATAPGPGAAAIARWVSRLAKGAAPLPVPILHLVAGALYATRGAAHWSEAKALAAVHARRLAA